jgi:hypothetical protein
VARFYDPAIAHFVQMDSLVPEPGTLKSFDRYAYVSNNPISFNDPSGHCYNYSTPQNAAICNAYWKQYEEAMRKKYAITTVAPNYSTLSVVTSKDSYPSQ